LRSIDEKSATGMDGNAYPFEQSAKPAGRGGAARRSRADRIER
jgi:hypothetical protein